MKISRMLRRMAYLLALIMLVLSFETCALAADGLNAAHYKLMLVKRGEVAGDVKINVRRRADADSDRIGRMEPGDSVIVTGEEGDWYQVEFGEEIGYIRKDLLNVTESEEEVAVIVEDPLEASLTGFTPPTLLRFRNEYRMKGVIASNIPMISVTAEVYNVRTFRIDRSEKAEFRRADNELEFDLEDLDLSFRKLDPGEKKLIIRVESTNESVVVSETSFYVYTDGEVYTQEANMTDDCRIRVADGDIGDLSDSNYRTFLTLANADAKLTITLPEDRTAEVLTLHWQKLPENATIAFYGEDDAEIGSITETNPSDMYHFYYPVQEGTRKIVVSTADEGGNALCEIRVYEPGQVSEVVQQWQPLPEKVDMMVVSAHQDDELLFFGGTIPYYAAQGKTIGMVYMAECSRKRYAEALDGLWSCGLEHHPVFIGLADKRTDTYEEAVDLWGKTATENTLVALIRKYKPEVLVTHDVNGEYGHNQHILTCELIRSAVTKAGDPLVDPASAEQYGLWTPKKLYIHLYEENEIIMEVYDEPVEELDGMTMTQVATIGYSKHVSQQGAYQMETHGVRYDNRKYGLAFTTVGQDVEKNDFFENID